MISTILLVATVALCPIIGGGAGELPESILQTLVFLAVIITIFTHPKGTVWPRVPGALFLGAFLLWTIFSSFFSPSWYGPLHHIVYLSGCIAAFLLSARICRDPRNAAGLQWAMIGAALIVCLLSLRSYAVLHGGGTEFWNAMMTPGGQERLFGPFENPNLFSGYLVLSILPTLSAYLIVRGRLFVLIAGISFIMQVACILLTGSKFGAASLGLGTTIFFAIMIYIRAFDKGHLKRLAIMILLLVPVIFAFKGPLTGRISEAGTEGTQTHSASFRVYTWQATWNMIKANPFVGVGPGMFETSFPRYAIAGPTTHAHQTYLQLAAESGLPAMVFFVLAVGSIAYLNRKSAFRRWTKCSRTSVASTDGRILSWEDVAHFSSWQITGVAIMGSLAASLARNMADSDYYTIGIALTFSVLAGTMVAGTGSGSDQISLRKGATRIIVGVFGLLVLASLSFGLGDLFASGIASPGGRPAYSIAQKFSPLNAEYFRNDAIRLYYARTNPALAMKKIDRAIELAPTNSVSYYVKGMLLLQTEEPQEAVEAFKKSLEYHPRSTMVLYTLLKTYDSLGMQDESDKIARRLLALENDMYETMTGVPEWIDPTYAFVHENLGHKYMEDKKYAEAEEQFRQAAQRLEDWLDLKRTIEIFRASGLLKEQDEAVILTALRESYTGLGDALSAQGKSSQAREAYEKAETTDDRLSD